MQCFRGVTEESLSAGLAAQFGGNGYASRVILGGIGGGVASKIYGGSFSDGFTDGAIQGAMAYAFNGIYDVLDHPNKEFFRLEAVDSLYGDDRQASSGRTNFRLHKPGSTIGCVAACNKGTWEKARDFIYNTRTSKSQVYKKVE